MKLPRYRQRIPIGGIAFGLALGLVATPEIRAQEAAGQQAARPGAALGVDLFRAFATRGGNVLFSPYSVSEALALLSEGAEGKTKRELLQALHWEQPSGSLATAFGAQDRHLEIATQRGAALLMANGLWFQRGSAPQPAFLKTARDAYGAEIREADFRGSPAAVQREINGWVDLKTFGKIHDLFSPGLLDANTRIALANAVYFKGKWERPFESNGTVPGPFYVALDGAIEAPMMHETEKLRAVSRSDCDLLELPYEGGALSMVILLPTARDGLAALERGLDSTTLQAWLAALDFSKERSLHVTLPRFGIRYSADLAAALKEIGVVSAFDTRYADFSALNGNRGLYVSAALHRAYIEVNEEGTEAAGASLELVGTLGIELSGEFKVDHPFIFLIRDNATGCLLFLGRVVNPGIQ
jgi:serpin B